MRTVATLAPLLALALIACGKGDASGPAGSGRIFVDSDPRGAAIVLDGSATGRFTPDTLPNVPSGTHTLELRLDSAGVAYALKIKAVVVANQLTIAALPVVTTCNATGNCSGLTAVFHDVANMHFATNPAATPFFTGGSGGGLLYPGPAGESYASAGAPIFVSFPVGSAGGIDVALGIYPFSISIPPLWAGRPAPPDSASAGRLVVHQTTWLVPPSTLANSWVPRGLQIEQRILGMDAVQGVLTVQVVFRNISATPLYRIVDPVVAMQGITYDKAYVGWGLDADIGASGGTIDDLYTFDPTLQLAMLYDGPMQEPGFNGPPALVGVRMLQPPAGATTVALSAWQAGTDIVGIDGTGNGWNIYTVAGKSGSVVWTPPPNQPGDWRIAVAAGPLHLAPGDTAAFTVAVVIAPPVPGTYTAGTVNWPGDPADAARPFNAMAAGLYQRARSAGQVQ